MESKSDSTPGESQNRPAEDEEHGVELELETTTGQMQALKLEEAGTGPEQNDIGLIGTDDNSEAAEKIMNSALLMEVIASKLPAKSLLTLRRTCKMWNFTFIPCIRKIHEPISLAVPSTSMWNYYYRDRSLTDFVNAFPNRPNKCDEVPYSHFVLKPGEKYANFRRLWRRFIRKFTCDLGTCIRRLEFKWLCERGALPIADFRELIFERTPNLEDLTLWGICSEVVHAEEVTQLGPGPVKVLQKLKRFTAKYFRNGFAAAFIEDIVRQASQLAYLNLGKDMRIPLRPLCGLQDSGHAGKLKTLRLSLASAAVLKQLANMDKIGLVYLQSVHLNLKFGSAELDERYQHEAVRDFHKFLQYQASTLRKLKIVIDCWTWYQGQTPDTESVFQIPRLERLHTLKLQCNETGLLSLKFGGDVVSNFEQTFPALRRFVDCSRSNVYSSVTENHARAMSEFSHSQVTHLDVCRILEKEISSMALLFPAVKDINLNPRRRFGPIVVQNWSKLIRSLWPGLVTLNGCKLECQREQQSDDETDS